MCLSLQAELFLLCGIQTQFLFAPSLTEIVNQRTQNNKQLVETTKQTADRSLDFNS
jgi:hypothetical protein